MAATPQPSIYELMTGLEAPSIAQYGQANAAAQAGIAELPSSLGLQGAQLQQTTGLSEALLGTERAGTGLQEQNVAQQYGIGTQQSALSQLENTQQYQNTAGTLGLEQALLGTQSGLAGQEQGLAQQAFGIQQGQLNYNLPLQEQAAAGQAAASGASNTVGAKNAQNTLQEQYGVSTGLLQNQAQQSALQYQGQQAGFAEQAGEYGIQGTAAQQSYQNTAQNLALTQQGATLSEQNQLAQLAQTAAGQGISQQQLQAQLASGLTQIGISGEQQQNQFLQQAAQAQAGQAQGLGAILSNVGATTGLGASAFTGSFPNLYGG